MHHSLFIHPKIYWITPSFIYKSEMSHTYRADWLPYLRGTRNGKSLRCTLPSTSSGIRKLAQLPKNLRSDASENFQRLCSVSLSHTKVNRPESISVPGIYYLELFLNQWNITADDARAVLTSNKSPFLRRILPSRRSSWPGWLSATCVHTRWTHKKIIMSLLAQFTVLTGLLFPSPRDRMSLSFFSLHEARLTVAISEE